MKSLNRLTLPTVRAVLVYLSLLYAILFFSSLVFGGVTWDESFDFEGVNGAFWHGLNFLKGLPVDSSSITFDLEYFGNATRWPTYLIWRLLNTAQWESFVNPERLSFFISSSYVGLNHLNSAIFGYLGIIAVFLLGRVLGGSKLAVLSALFLLTLPTWLGHSWMNSKDIPLATCYLYYTLGSTIHLKYGNQYSGLSRLIRLISISLMIGSRLGSVVFIAISEILLSCFGKSYKARVVQLQALIPALALAFLLTPQAWNEPFGYPIKALEFISERQNSVSSLTSLLYIVYHLFESIPLSMLLGCLLLPFAVYKGRFKFPQIVYWSPLLSQLLIAPVVLVIGSKSLYGELRHIIFIYPPICMLSALGLIHFFERVKNRFVCAIISGVLLLLLTLQVFEVVLLSPYQYIYRSDTARLLAPGPLTHKDYWGFSFRETLSDCVKNPQCNNQLTEGNIQLPPWEWNKDLFNAYIALFSRKDDKDTSQLQNLAATTQYYFKLGSLDNCQPVAMTSRLTLIPRTTINNISSIYSCNHTLTSFQDPKSRST